MKTTASEPRNESTYLYLSSHNNNTTMTTAASSPSKKIPQSTTPMSLVKEIFGGCICQGAIPPSSTGEQVRASQFISIHGIEFIGLGAVVDELTAKERVYDTLEQLTSRTERLISIGYLSLEASNSISQSGPVIVIETVPLDVWDKTYPNDQSMAKTLKKKIANITVSMFCACSTCVCVWISFLIALCTNTVFHNHAIMHACVQSTPIGKEFSRSNHRFSCRSTSPAIPTSQGYQWIVGRYHRTQRGGSPCAGIEG